MEERRESAKRWVMEKLRRSRKGWPRLLAHPEYDSARVLMLARFFEEFDSWSASLGAGLAELLVHDERQTRRVLGQELCFVPCVDRRLIGSLAAFAGPSEARSDWLASATQPNSRSCTAARMRSRLWMRTRLCTPPTLGSRIALDTSVSMLALPRPSPSMTPTATRRGSPFSASVRSRM